MGLIAPAVQLVTPSFMEPETIMQYSQVSGAFDLLPNGMPKVKLAPDDLVVYGKRLDLRTKIATGQSAYNLLPTVEPVFSLISTPTYLARIRYEYDHHDAAAAARWGHAVTNLFRLASRQAHFQLMRTALLYGMNPSLGEGIVNTAGATAINLPADNNGNQTIVTYDNGQMAQFLLQLIGSIKTRTNNLGIPRKITILAPQRILQQWQYNIVQVTTYQRPGAGTDSTAGVVEGVSSGGNIKDDVTWVADDTLIGKGAGGTDLVIFAIPEVAVPDTTDEINTNEFAKLTPGWLECLAQYCDMVAPREITAPLPGGAVDTLSEHRISSGWCVRPEALTLLSAQYQ